MSITREDRHVLKLSYLYLRAKREKHRRRIECTVSSLSLDARTLFAALTLLLLDEE